ncbi:hypothetical protein [Aerobium aerolatum]|uniref:Uncharacterized protein n=1 Tax=Aquamicrobium aerolatum DSM 21857 TaxID=1121003 RepID=A0A1I3JHD5_9HYPH|nr:hypothetical protein [Aquamicrobium aerolatum]SFI59325.1 hypothetical protein SAMN03080618_00846 [Aquamicrobium aerolatum DSM 21857]
MIFHSPELARFQEQIRLFEKAQESLLAPFKTAMATLPESEPLPTLADIAAAICPAAPAIQINIFINKEDCQ